MPFEVNTGTSADPLDGTEKLPVSQGGEPRVVTANEFIYLNAANRMFTDKTVEIDTGTGGSITLGDSSLAINAIDGLGCAISVTGGLSLDILADSGQIANSAGSTSNLSWGAAGVTATFRNATNSGVLIYDTDASHTLRIAPGSNLSANRTFTLITGNADCTLDISAGSNLDAVAASGIASAWTSFTPTITATVGAFTTTTPTGFYKQLGKTVFVRIRIVVGAVGTADGNILSTIPVAALAATDQFLGGVELENTGNTVRGFIRADDVTKIRITFYNNSFCGGTGNVILLQGTYEAA